MYHKHFDQIPSTQSYLKDQLTELLKIDSAILISCEAQTSGHGRNQKTWNDSEGGIAFSFTYFSKITPTLVPLLIALEIRRFFQEYHKVDIDIKWPNDLYYLNKKCGGIICQKNDEYIIVGVGINVFTTPEVITDQSNEANHLNLKMNSHYKKLLPHELYQFILKSQMNQEMIIKAFNQIGLFINQKVQIAEDEKIFTGNFLGIGELGEAIIKKDNGDISKIYNGTLRKK